MEGVMMKNKDQYAVAVRKPDNEIAVEISTHKDFSDKVKLFKLPIFRGMMAFVDSMVVGVKVLNYSASFFEDEEEAQAQKEKEKKKKAKKAKDFDDDFEMEELSVTKSENLKAAETVSEEVQIENSKKDGKSNAILMIFAVLFSIVLSVSLFMVLPVFITGLFSTFVTNRFLISFIEGIIRLTIFIGYVILASRMQEIKRVFMYHGAEHKTINCLENGLELTVENVRWQSKQHKRCGTSFMLLVILISLVFFMAVPVNGMFWKVVSRVLLVPFIAGVSYEFIRLAGRSENKLVNVLSQPGLWMQGLTTKEPDDSMIEVAIKSVSAVFDWRAFLDNSGEQTQEPKTLVDKPEESSKQKETGKQKSKEKQNVAAATKKLSGEDINKETAATKEASGIKTETHKGAGKRGTGTAPVNFKPDAPSRQEEEEDDEILKALDKFFDNRQKDLGKAAED